MANITMDTDWGAKGAQLTGAQVQAFIKGELIALQNKCKEIEKSIGSLDQSEDMGALQKELSTIKEKITNFEKGLETINDNPSDWLETNKESVSYIKNKPEIVTVETMPDENLKSYVNADGTTVNFKIGDFVRYKNDDGKYVFYQINDIDGNGKISWSEGGGGGNVDVRETARIILESNQPQPDSSLKGATVIVAENGGNELYNGAWNGEEIRVKITPMTEYTVSVSNIDGYATPEAKSYTSAFQGDRTISMVYNSCLLTVQTAGLENNEDHTITVKYGSSTKNIKNGQSVKVPVGVSVEVTSSAVSGYATPAKQSFIPYEASKTITLAYTPSALKVTIDSNQSDKSDLSNLKATVTYSGSSVQVSSGQVIPIPVGVEVRISFPALNGYLKPADITLTNQGGLVEKTGTYQTELVAVTLSADNSASMAGQTVTINGTAHTYQGSPVSVKIPFGTSYSVSVNDKEAYIAPSQQNFTANQAIRAVTMQYIYNPIKKGYYILDDTVNDPATKVTLTPEVTDVINWIRANSHRVLAKKTSDGVCKVIRLMDSDTTKYFDGTPAPITDTNYDVMMMMPEFWYTAESAGADKWKIWFADGNPEDGKKWHKWDHGHLIGVYEAYNASNKVYSVSGKDSTGSVSQANFKTYARNKGKGYTIIDWQAHCIMAFLFYGYYKNTNSQGKCGVGTNDYQKQTGQTNSLGMTDTTTANGNSMSINFWGLENWWGNKYEWMDNIVVDARVWKITEKDGSVRTAGTGGSADGWITKLLVGDQLDMIPVAVGGSETTGYSDYYYQSSSTSRVVRRSYSYSYAYGGVSCADALVGSSFTGSYGGSRLAFNGTIVEAESVSSFTA